MNPRHKLQKSKQQKKYLEKECALCGRRMKVIVYPYRSYRGGHYFGRMPLCRKKELARALKAGTGISHIGQAVFEVLKKDPKPYAHF